MRASPVLIGGKIMIVGDGGEEMLAGPSTSQTHKDITLNLGPEYFDEKLCYAPKEERALQRIQLCKTIIPVTDSIKKEKFYMRNSTPRDEPEIMTRLRREAYEKDLSAGSFLFLTQAVWQAAACDGTRITTTADGQQIAPETFLFVKMQANKHFYPINSLVK